MALPKYRKAVLAILGEVTPFVIGLEPKFVKADIGDVATKIVPGGDLFPSDEVVIYTWKVEIENEITHNLYTVTLDAFVPYEQLEKIFFRHFGPNPSRVNPFEIPTHGINRVRVGYPAAVRIRDNEKVTEFIFDWGKDQDVARAICNLFGHSSKVSDPEKIKSIIKILRSIKPIIFAGGPPPQLHFESRWLDNYSSALETVEDEECVSIDIRKHTKGGKTDITYMTLKFHK